MMISHTPELGTMCCDSVVRRRNGDVVAYVDVVLGCRETGFVLAHMPHPMPVNNPVTLKFCGTAEQMRVAAQALIEAATRAEQMADAAKRDQQHGHQPPRPSRN